MEALTPEAWRLAAIVAVVIVLWCTEALPLAVTALLGAAACVLLGVAPAKEVFRPFADPLIFLFIGSFLLAEAIRLHRLDRRLAYAVLAVPWVGEKPVRMLAAVAVVSVAISAFISNTVTAAMMVAIVSGILAAIDEAAVKTGRRPDPAFATGLLLCVAFAASIGGLATPIGTPTNLIGLRFIADELGVAISFVGWCAIGLPIVAVMTTITVFVLGRLFPAGIARLDGVSAYVAAERARLGPWTAGQWSTALAFAATVAMWMVPGFLLAALGPDHEVCVWLKNRLPESVAAIIGAALLFILPGDAGRPALAWKDARIDWDVVLLYGGGIALGELCFSQGLASAAGTAITGWIPAGAWAGTLLVVAAALLAVFTSEFTSNVASATMVVPVVIALGQAVGGNALVAALAATFAASLGFMMPVSSPCNAIVYGTGRIPLRAMMAGGVILDLVGLAVIAAVMLGVARIW
ncbi:MAG: DASS family sodium-coupled anion symporter [Planctomycetaceae bacterium]|nr:DASS family sodium-coupled anion symporter [Planctomycetaceae bacterium]